MSEEEDDAPRMQGRLSRTATCWASASARTHQDAAFDIDYITSDAYSNKEFLALLKKVVRKREVTSMRSFLGALHQGNLVLQSKTAAYRQITGKGSKESGDAAAEAVHAACVESAKTDPAWMLKYGPAGDLPIHLTFLLGKRVVGREMLMALESIKGEVLEAYWDQCYRVHAKYPDTTEPVPKKKSNRGLIKWIINLPYQSDVLWWFKEVARREHVGARGARELVKAFNYFVPKRKREEVLANDVGLFTGETLMHIAIQCSDLQLVDWLICSGARVDAKAAGLFFQPEHIPILSDNNSKWFWQPRLEKNDRAGCYYGEFPLSFAASIGDIDMIKLIIDYATQIIEQQEHLSCPFILWLDGQVSYLLEESEGFHAEFAGKGGLHRTTSKRISAFINVQDTHGNTALHMAVLFEKRDVVEWLLENGALPSLTLMNASFRTPLTLALHCPTVFNAILANGFRETVWQYGDSEMTLISLYQVDTYRVGKPKGRIEKMRTFMESCWASLRRNKHSEDDPFADTAAAAEEGDVSESQYGHAGAENFKGSWEAVENGKSPGRQDVNPAVAKDKSINLDDFDDSRQFKLHLRKGWKSALEIAVEHEMHVLRDIPIFEELIQAKWNAFGLRMHLTYCLLPYLLFFTCFNAALLLRCSDVETAFHNEDMDGEPISIASAFRRRGISGGGGGGAPSSVVNETEIWVNGTGLHIGMDDMNDAGAIALRVLLDFFIFCVCTPWLAFKAWQDNRFLSAYLDVNQDLNITWEEVMMYLYKNVGSILDALIVLLLTCTALARLAQPQGWFSLPVVLDEDSEAIAVELDLLSLCSVLVWLHLLVLLLPFKRIGQMLLGIYSMLVGDVSRWIVVFLVFLGAFSLGSYAAMVMSSKVITDVFENSVSSRDYGFGLLLLQFCYMAAGEVVPGNLAKVARNVNLINVYNLAFILFSTTILVNLLVALMGSTYLRHTQLGRQMWWNEFADLVLRYEQRLSERQRERFRTGESVGDASDLGPCEHYLVSIGKLGQSAVMESTDKDLDEQDALQHSVHSMSEEIRTLNKQVENLTDLLTSLRAAQDGKPGALKKEPTFIHSDWSALQETLDEAENENDAKVDGRATYTAHDTKNAIETSLGAQQVRLQFGATEDDLALDMGTPKAEVRSIFLSSCLARFTATRRPCAEGSPRGKCEEPCVCGGGGDSQSVLLKRTALVIIAGQECSAADDLTQTCPTCRSCEARGGGRQGRS